MLFYVLMCRNRILFKDQFTVCAEAVFHGKGPFFPSCCFISALKPGEHFASFFYSQQFSLFQCNADNRDSAAKKCQDSLGLLYFTQFPWHYARIEKRAKHKMRFNIYKCGFAVSQSNSTTFQVFALHIYVSILFFIGILFVMSCVSRFSQFSGGSRCLYKF